ncbi:MAG: ABC transporter permease subunit [Pseudomonadota bacterium]
MLLSGAAVTVGLAVTAFALATVVGAVGAVCRLSGRWSGAIVLGFTSVARGIPDLVLFLIFYFGGQRLVNQIGALLGWEYVALSQFWAGALAIGVLYGAYLVETFRGAFSSVPTGQGEAAMAIGLSRLQGLWTVILPQLVRAALPGYANVWHVLVKSTAVVSVIGLEDLVGLANDAGKSVREPFLFFGFALLVYLCVYLASNSAFGALERRVRIPGRAI